MSGLIGFTGTVLLVYGAFRFNVWVGWATMGFVLMTVAQTMSEIKRHHEYHEDERDAAMGRHPTATPSGELRDDDFR